MKRFSILSAAFLGAALLASVPAAMAQDGAKVFKRCQACHSLKAGQNKVGPSLHGVVGRKAGGADGFRYSKLNQQAGELGLVWTEENIAAYLPNPQGFLEKYIEENGGDPSGRTRMSYRLKGEDDIVAVIDYIKSQSE